MLKRRTDLAIEAKELWAETAAEQTQLEGVEARDTTQEGFSVNVVKVLNEQGASAIGKPAGTYVTINLEGLEKREDDAFGRAARAIAAELKPLLSVEDKAPVLVAGLGNRDITPDAVGPHAVEHTMVTRHLVQQLPDQFGSFRPVSAVAAGVLGTTGMETQEMIRGVIEQVKPACLIAVDALASRALNRVCTTVQITDTGIVPGSGVANSRAAITREALGIPVVAVGVPTVVDAGTLAADVATEAGQKDLDSEALAKFGGSLMVTPRDIDARVADMAKVVGFGINLALHPGISMEDIDMFLS